EDFNLADYSRKVFRMFGSDEETEVELLCETGMMNGIVDQFGTKVKTEEVDEDHFKATVVVCPSPTFYRWVFGWNGGIRITGPETIKEEYKAMLKQALND
ncbi:MAG: WYL domain-containing protein, partial [Lachnospiraceae bacterium]|nr:WYL domain-containing protein [Lachnospiraceae bacterium]